MLCLSRRPRPGDDSITITTPSGETIEVRLISVRDGQIRLGFTADRNVNVMRTELLDRRKGGAA